MIHEHVYSGKIGMKRKQGVMISSEHDQPESAMHSKISNGAGIVAAKRCVRAGELASCLLELLKIEY